MIFYNPEYKKPPVDEWVLAIHLWELGKGYEEPYIGYISEDGHWFSKDTGEPLNVIKWAKIDMEDEK